MLFLMSNKVNIRKQNCIYVYRCQQLRWILFHYEYIHFFFFTEMQTHSLNPRFHENNGCVLLIRHMKQQKKKKKINKKRAGDLCRKSWQFGISEYLYKSSAIFFHLYRIWFSFFFRKRCMVWFPIWYDTVASYIWLYCLSYWIWEKHARYAVWDLWSHKPLEKERCILKTFL